MRSRLCPSKKVRPSVFAGRSERLPSRLASKGRVSVKGGPFWAGKREASCQSESKNPTKLFELRPKGMSQTSDAAKRWRTSKLAEARSALRLKESCATMGAPAMGKISETSSMACDQV